MTSGEEFRFSIDAYTPETLPLERLAEYLSELAVLFGESKAVHFVRIDSGSVVPIVKVDREAVPKVRERVHRVAWGAGPGEALRAYRNINRKLREDNAVGFVQEPAGAAIIRFPGREQESTEFVSVRQHGSLDGEVIRLGGKGEIIPVTLQSESRTFSHCFAKKTTAKNLAGKLFEPVRLFGTGRWTRDGLGIWNLDNFIIDRFEELGSQSLSAAIDGIRSISGWDLGGDAFGELADLRHGAGEVQ